MAFPRSLETEQVMDLEANITIDEVKRAVWECGKDKSPGPDGFTFDFLKRFWYLVGDDVFNAVN